MNEVFSHVGILCKISKNLPKVGGKAVDEGVRSVLLDELHGQLVGVHVNVVRIQDFLQGVIGKLTAYVFIRDVVSVAYKGMKEGGEAKL